MSRVVTFKAIAFFVLIFSFREFCWGDEGDQRGFGVSKSTYSSSNPIPAKNWLLQFLPVHTEEDECTDDTCICVLDGVGYKQIQGRVCLEQSVDDVYDGFGLHHVNCSCNSFPGGMNVVEVEQEFVTKLGDMTSFDSFMDYNVALYTDKLEQYVRGLEEGGVSYLPILFRDQGHVYYGIIVQVAKSQMVLELVTARTNLTSWEFVRKMEGHPNLHEMEQRMSTKALAHAQAQFESGTVASGYFQVVSVGRAASDLEAIDTFYTAGMQCDTTLSFDTEDVSKRCYLWEGATADVCFTKRPDSMTSTDFKVTDFETMLNTVHANIMMGGTCNNKWLDNHYAVDNFTMYGDYIVDYVEAEGDIYFYCDPQPSMHYIIDPTGWGVQLDMSFGKLPSACQDISNTTQKRQQQQLAMDPAIDVACSCLTQVACGPV